MLEVHTAIIIHKHMTINRTRQIAIKLISSSIGLLFLYYGIIAIPTGLFVGPHVLAMGFRSLGIAYKFLLDGSRATVATKYLWRLQLDSSLLAISSLVLACWSWFESEFASIIVWCVLMIANVLLSWLSLLELRSQL